MPLPTGMWRINVNGKEGNLDIQLVDPQGVVKGTLFDVAPFRGFWNEMSQSIVFMMTKHSTGPDMYDPYYFRGFLFSTPPEPPAGADVLWTLAGFVGNPGPPSDITVLSHIGVDGTARRNEFGWFAQITQIF